LSAVRLVEAARSEPPRPTTRTDLATPSPSGEPAYLSVGRAVVVPHSVQR